MTACLLARGERNRHVSFHQNASVGSRRCQRTFQGIWRFADNGTPAETDNANIICVKKLNFQHRSSEQINSEEIIDEIPI